VVTVYQVGITYVRRGICDALLQYTESVLGVQAFKHIFKGTALHCGAMARSSRPSPGPQIACFTGLLISASRRAALKDEAESDVPSSTPASSDEVDMIEDDGLPLPNLKRKSNARISPASARRAKRPRTSGGSQSSPLGGAFFEVTTLIHLLIHRCP